MKKLPVSPVAVLLAITFATQSAAPAFAAGARSTGRDNSFNLVDESPESRAAEFVMRRYPGETLIPVRILSGVKSPGIYYLPEGTDMLTALTLAGGLTSTADPDKVHLNQASTQSEKTFTLDNVMMAPKKTSPVLAANDIVMIDETKPLISTNTVLLITVVSGLLGVALAAKAINK